MESTLSSLPGVNYVRLELPPKTYFQDDESPAVLHLDSDKRLDQDTFQSVAAYISLHGWEKLEISYLEIDTSFIEKSR